MARRDPNTFDLTAQKVRVASDIRFWPVHQRGTLVYRVEIPQLHRFFRVGYEEYVLLSLLDGETTLPQACGLAAAKLGRKSPSVAEATLIVRWAMQHGIAHLASTPSPSRDRVEKTVQPTSPLQWLGKVNPFWIKLPVLQNHPALASLSNRLSPLFSIRVVSAFLGVILVAMMVLATRWTEFVESSSDLFLPSSWWKMLVAWVALKFVHELAHSAACQRLGGDVREAGIVFVLFAPLAYVDVSSCWRMSSRWSRIAVAAAGMYVEMVIAAVAILLWTLTDSEVLKFTLYQIAVTAGVSTLLFNANVLMRFDGYFILADLVDIPNLHTESSIALKNACNRLLTGGPAEDRGLHSWRRPLVFGYGIASFAWKILVCVTLFIAASTMWEGAGIVIAVMGLVIWIGQPVSSLYRSIVSHCQSGWTGAVRPVIVGGLIVSMAAWAILRMPIPTSLSVPSHVQYLPETLVRSRGSGFVGHVHVANGAIVRKGDRLLDLRNPELRNRITGLELQWQQNEIRLRQASDQHDSAEEQTLRENQAILLQQIEPLREQVAALTLTSPRDGRVIARHLAERRGSYINEGDVILIVANAHDKEVIVVICQDELDQARTWVGKQVLIRGQDHQPRAGQLSRIDPRATDRLPTLALAAIHGGPLAVQANEAGNAGGSDDSMRLLEPVFRGRIALAPDAASAIPAGSIAQVHLGYRKASLYERWKQTIREQWHQAHRR